MGEIKDSGILHATAFPQAVISPELVREYVAHCDIRSQYIRRNDGSVLLPVNLDIITYVFKILNEFFFDYTLT